MATDNAQTLQQIISEQRAGEFELPSLSLQFEFFDQLKRLFHKWMERIDELLRKIFGDVSFKPSPDTERILWIIVLSILGSLIVIALWTVIVRTRARLGTRRIPSTPLRDAVSREDLAEQLRLALERADWSKALRLRWKIFLGRVGAPADTTPQEFAKRGGVLTLADQKLFYQMMFDAVSPPDRGYAELVAVLDAEEPHA